MLNKTARDVKWKQDLASLTVELELKRTTLKKISLVVGRRFVRVTCPEKSFAKVIDLHAPVLFQTGTYKADYNGEVFLVELKKQDRGLWDSLWAESLTREEISARREEDVKELEDLEKKWHEEKQSAKVEQASLTTKEKMKIEDERRSKIEKIKEDEKQRAIQEVFSDEGARPRTSLTSKASKKENVIWDEEPEDASTTLQEPGQQPADLQDAPAIRKPAVERVIPAVRSVAQPEPIKLEFTERIFPTLAMRESQIKEAPAPKLRKLAQKLDKNPENTIKSPIWLKDKGDEFLQAGDYISAIDAYDSAVRLDPTYWAAYSNRSICHLKLHNLSECAADCNFLLSKLVEIDKNEKMTGHLMVVREKVYLRVLACDALRGEFQRFNELAELLLRENFLREAAKASLAVDVQTVKRRADVIRLKAEVDEQLRLQSYREAVEGYQQLLRDAPEEQNNERILSNLSLCWFKLGQHLDAIDACRKAIDHIESQLNKNLAQPDRSRQNAHFKSLLIKLHYRKAQCQLELGLESDSESSLRSVLLLDERNEEARSLKKRIEEKRDFEAALQAKAAGDSALKETHHKEALDHYRQAIAKLDPSSKPLEYLAVLLNMTVCHGALDQTDEIVSDCIKGLRVIDKFNKAVIKFEKSKLSKEDLEKLAQLELRFYMRKGNALLKKGQ